MHAYTITAEPGRWQRAARKTGRGARRGAVAGALLTLGVIVFAARTARVLVNLFATAAARLEYAAAIRTSTPPVGQTIGAAVTAEFLAEFRGGFAPPAPSTD